MKRIAALLLLPVLFASFCPAQSDSMVHVKAFPGSTVGQKVSNAMATCPSSPVPCILVIDASLAASATGTIPTLCANCYLQDWRTGIPSGTGGISGSPTLPTLGSLVNQTSWASLANYSANGTTPTISGGALVFSGGSGGYTSSLDWVGSSGSYTTTLPQWVMKATITVGTQSSSSYGIGIGIRSTNSLAQYYNAVCRIDLSNTGTKGDVLISTMSGGTTAAQSTGAVSVSAGDSVVLTFTRYYNQLTCTAADTTSASAQTASYVYSYLYSQTILSPNAGHFAIFNFGGTQTVTNFAVSSQAPVGATFAFLGDSKTVGYYQGAFSNLWTTQVQNLATGVTEAGGADATQDALNNLPEVIALKPKAVILNIGRNDYCLGSVSLGTVEANYASIVSQLTAAGISVYHLLPLYETACSQTAFTAWIQANYAASAIINPNLAQYGASYAVAGDGIHPTTAAANLIAGSIATFMQNTQGLQGFIVSAQASASQVTSNSTYFLGTQYTPSITNTGIFCGYSGSPSEPQCAWINAANGSNQKVFAINRDSSGTVHMTFANDALSSTHDALQIQTSAGVPTLAYFLEPVTATGLNLANGANTYGITYTDTVSRSMTLGTNQNLTAITGATPTDTQTCTAGNLWFDSSYIYVCTASGTVKRSALSSF